MVQPKREKKADMYYNDIIKLCRIDIKAVHYYYEASFTAEKADIKFDQVIHIDITKDFELGVYDNAVLTVKMSKDVYIRSLFPLRDNFKIKLSLTQVNEKESGMKLTSPKKHVELYRGVIVNPIDYGTSSEASTTPFSNSDANKESEMVQVQIQLIPPVMELVSKQTFGGNFNGVPGEVLKLMLTEAFNHAKPEYGESIRGVQMHPPDMTKEYEDIAIDQATRVIDLPRHIQEKWYGVYNYHIGSYYMNEIWWVYPLYNYTRFNTDSFRLTISVIPKGYMLDNMRTYHVNNREVNVISSGGVEQKDNSNAETMNQGNGVTLYDGNAMKNEVVVKNPDGSVHINPSPAKKQVMQEGRDDELNYAPAFNQKLTSSLAQAMSTVAQRNALVMQFVWEYANPHLLIPGMPVKVVYYKEDQRYEITGTLLKQVSNTQIAGKDMVKKHLTSVAMVVVADRNLLKKADDKKYASNTKGSKGSKLDKIKSWFD